MFAVCCFILFKIDYSTLYFTLQRYLKKSKSHIIFWISILIYVKIILFDLILAKIDKYRLVIRYILGTTVQLCLSFFLNLNYIASLFHILGRNAQCHFTSHLFSFSTVLFQQKGKEENEDDGLDVDALHLRPIISSFTANGLNLIMRMWVRFKRPHR